MWGIFLVRRGISCELLGVSDFCLYNIRGFYKDYSDVSHIHGLYLKSTRSTASTVLIRYGILSFYLSIKFRHNSARNRKTFEALSRRSCAAAFTKKEQCRGFFFRIVVSPMVNSSNADSRSYLLLPLKGNNCCR